MQYDSFNKTRKDSTTNDDVKKQFFKHASFSFDYFYKSFIFIAIYQMVGISQFVFKGFPWHFKH